MTVPGRLATGAALASATDGDFGSNPVVRSTDDKARPRPTWCPGWAVRGSEAPLSHGGALLGWVGRVGTSERTASPARAQTTAPRENFAPGGNARTGGPTRRSDLDLGEVAGVSLSPGDR